jgi:hypothetical protein
MFRRNEMYVIEKVLGKWLRKKNCGCHFGDDDRVIEGFRLNAVHEIPERGGQGTELDYYLDTGKDIYLLRLQYSGENRILFVPSDTLIINKGVFFTYIIVRKRLSEELRKDINTELREIVITLKTKEFPRYYQERIFEIEEWGKR